MSSNDIVVLGRLAEAYGIQGWIRLHPFGDDPLGWRRIPVWYLGREGGPWREAELHGLKAHGDGLVVSFVGIADRTAAEGLKGQLIGVPREALPETGDGEFYWADLLGLAVVNEEGALLGKVAALIETGANDVLQVVNDAGEERLLPFVDAVVLEVDKPAGVIRVAWGCDW
ncbi:ribosome maturation factor RimM [Azonexus caeni]|uniref:ribosome maturation factor RimM n=1 Tax=Azonexus caeni TaxID=266126 RepID=UPI003A84748A